MKLIVDKEKLVKGVQIVQNVIGQKSNLPILSYMLIEAKENKVNFTTTNLDIGITHTLIAKVEEPGIVILPAKKFGDIIRELPDREIHIITKKNNLTLIDTHHCQFKLMGLPYDEFPKLPKFTNQEIVRINQDEIKDMLKFA